MGVLGSSALCLGVLGSSVLSTEECVVPRDLGSSVGTIR